MEFSILSSPVILESLDTIEIFAQLVFAGVLGMALGAERRILAEKSAGMRTYALVAIGATLFIAVSTLVTQEYIGLTNFDPLRVAANIVVGIGFLGGGIIIFREQRLSGLTTAAGIWVAGGIGIAVGFKMYAVAVFTMILTLLVFTAMRSLEQELEGAYKRLTSSRREKRENKSGAL